MGTCTFNCYSCIEKKETQFNALPIINNKSRNNSKKNNIIQNNPNIFSPILLTDNTNTNENKLKDINYNSNNLDDDTLSFQVNNTKQNTFYMEKTLKNTINNKFNDIESKIDDNNNDNENIFLKGNVVTEEKLPLTHRNKIYTIINRNTEGLNNFYPKTVEDKNNTYKERSMKTVNYSHYKYNYDRNKYINFFSNV